MGDRRHHVRLAAARRDAPLWSFRAANWGFWLVTLGIAAMALVLAAQGLQQGFMLMAGTEWVHSINAIRPYWWIRSLTGIAMDVGVSLLVYTLMRHRSPRPAWRRPAHDEIDRLAGGRRRPFFVTLAMFVQGFLPAMIPESRSHR